ncbi:MAG TPA: 1,4-alpha-glucan branching protein GlgB [Candidatus Acidoferrales bacterium]|nr:1,4-alpha-glucan branching protein GlgB [Candidatus Acidoferrales bacterium]
MEDAKLKTGETVAAELAAGGNPAQEQATAALPRRKIREGFEGELDRLALAEHSDPFAILGAHWVSRGGREELIVRALRPEASEISVVWGGEKGTGAAGAAAAAAKVVAASRIHEDGLFEAIVPAEPTKLAPGAAISPGAYKLRVRYGDASPVDSYDAYSFPPLLTDYDLHLISEGTHYEKYKKVGAHAREVEGVKGVHFGVWAPNAKRVSVVGDFNSWDGRVNPMRNRGTSGVWEIFIPEIGEGALYKFEILSQQGELMALKSDPYGFAAELRPKSASVVCDIESYQWNDAEWMEARRTRDWQHAPMTVYEVHAGAWRRRTEDGNRWLTYRELADEMVPYVKSLGYTHIELMPIMEHPFDGSWGYQTTGYFAVTSRYGSPTDFMAFVDRCHQQGIGVILDWTPAHFPRDAHGLAYFDGTHLYEHADPRKGAHPDWGTLVFNYGRNEVQNFLLSNALFWIEKYHADGLRVDAVASMLYLDYSRNPGEWIPNQFGGRENLEAIGLLKRLNEVLHQRDPGALMIAEESTAWPAVSRPTYVGGLGFDLKWNMGWMNDTLKYMEHEPIHRQYHQNDLTFSMIYAFHENFVLPLSHDEVVHGKRALLEKMPGDDWQKFANLRLLFAYMYAHSGKKLLFMGGELGQRWEFWEGGSVEWELENSPPHRGIQRLIADLNRLHAAEKALHELDFEGSGFEWMNASDAAASVLAFVRRAKCTDDIVLAVCNFTPVVREEYRVGVPRPGFYKEILNSDSKYYEGSDVGNSGGVWAEPIPWNDRPYSVKLKLPPLAVMYFKPQ